VYRFESKRADLSIELPDDYSVREHILAELHKYVRAWLSSTISRAPVEMQGLLQVKTDFPPFFIGASFLRFESQSYIDIATEDQDKVESEMGKSVAVGLARALPGNARERGSLGYGIFFSLAASSDLN
jgi:phosphatidylinositol 4-kinase